MNIKEWLIRLFIRPVFASDVKRVEGSNIEWVKIRNTWYFLRPGDTLTVERTTVIDKVFQKNK